MRERLKVKNSKELSQTAKVLGFTTSDFFVGSIYLLFSPMLNINAFVKLLIPLVLISLNKFINRKHPGNIIFALLKRKQVLKWSGAIREIKK